jgi:hypothetical protein
MVQSLGFRARVLVRCADQRRAIGSKLNPPAIYLEATMSIIGDSPKANRNYARSHDRKLARPPAPRIAVVTYMDPRLSNLPAILGLPQSDIDVIRTGGPAVTDDPVLNAREQIK